MDHAGVLFMGCWIITMDPMLTTGRTPYGVRHPSHHSKPAWRIQPRNRRRDCELLGLPRTRTLRPGNRAADLDDASAFPSPRAG